MKGPALSALVAATLVSCLLIAGVTPIVGAAERPAETHCVVDVVGQRADGQFAVTGPRCHATFAEAMLDASGGELELLPDTDAAVVLSDSQLEARIASFTLGIHYDGSNGTGSSISVTGSSCSGGYWNTGPSWANKISSSWNGCYRLRHYDNPNKTGTYGDTLGAGSVHNVPSYINNKAESVAYYGS